MRDLVNAHAGKPLYHMVVMDNGTVSHGGNAAAGRCLHHINRPLDPGTEARSFRYFNSHTPSP